MGRKKDPSKKRNENPALIDDDAYVIIVKESTERKLSKKWSREEYSFKYLISEAVKQMYGKSDE